MKQATTIFQDGDHQWVAIARDPSKPGYVIDSVEYVILKGGKVALLDPGGQEIFPTVFTALSSIASPDDIEFLFASHQDPDIISSLPLWLAANPELKCYLSWLWCSFVPHFGGDERSLLPIPDEGMTVSLAGELELELIPAHYLHSAGNFSLYDARAKILWTGDIGAALLPEGAAANLFVTDFSKHVEFMRGFHTRWMGSNEAKNDWIDRVSTLDIEMICPQHGAIFRRADVPRFLTWFRELTVGSGRRFNRGK